MTLISTFDGITHAMNSPIKRQLFVVSSSLLAAMSTGGVLGLPSILSQQLKRNDSLIKLDQDIETWMESVHGFTSVPSVIIVYQSQCWGRRFGFRASCLAVLIGWIMLCFANNSLTMIIAEIFQGVGVKSLLLVCMMIICEMVDPKIRNRSIVLYGVIQTFLVLLVHTSGNFIHWKSISLIMCFPLALAIIFSFIWPESPAWLAYKGRFEESKKSFIWLRGKNKESLEEMNALFSAQREFLCPEMSLKTEKCSQSLICSVWQKITGRDFYIPIIHIYVLLCCYYKSGVLFITVYASNVIGTVIKNRESAFMGMIVIDIAFVIGNLSSSILLKYFGNKPILLTGGASSILCLLCLSSILYLQKIGIISDDSTLCLYFLVGFIVCFSEAFYMIPFGIATEIIPLQHRGVVGSIYILFMIMLYTSSLNLVPYLIVQLGIHGICLLYAIILIFCLVWIWKFVPETRNKTLQSIEEHFVGNSKDPDMVMIDEETNEYISFDHVK